MIKIAIQGEPGSFSHAAATRFAASAGETARIVHCSLSPEVFSALVRSEVDAAVIPIENSLAGSVSEHFDLMLTHDVTIVRESLLRIKHNLIAISGTQIDQIDRVFSHPVALAQCRRFLSEHPRMESFAFYDTAGSVKQLVELRDSHAAAIASEEAARYYGAEILASGIEDNPENFTRFFYLRRSAEVTPEAAANKLSLAFTVENRVGTLVAALRTGQRGNQPDQDRVPASPRPPLGVCLLRRLPTPHARRRHPCSASFGYPLLHGQGTGPLPGGQPLRSRLALSPANLVPYALIRTGLW